MAVVALCAAENDITHAGYLATALLFFRRRLDLRTQRNRRAAAPLPPPPLLWQSPRPIGPVYLGPTGGLSACLSTSRFWLPGLPTGPTRTLVLALPPPPTPTRVLPCRLFFWLPAYNMAAMAASLVYQAPLEALFDWPLDPETRVSRGRAGLLDPGGAREVVNEPW